MNPVRSHYIVKKFAPGPEAPSRARRSSVISAYLDVLDKMKGPLAAELELPFAKEQIAQAILEELADGPGYDLAKRLEISYVLLESFVSCEEYLAVEDFKNASLRAEKIADSQNPSSILKSARIMKTVRGERAVRIQEQIHEKMKKRQLDLLGLEKGEAA